MSKKMKPLARLQRLIEIKQRDVKSSQVRLHQKRLELKQQHERLTLYRQEYVKMLMASNTSPLQMDDTRRFLQKLEISIDETKVSLDSHTESEASLQAVAVKLNSQQKSVERRISVVADTSQSVEDAGVVSVPGKSPYSRESSAD